MPNFIYYALKLRIDNLGTKDLLLCNSFHVLLLMYATFTMDIALNHSYMS